MYYLTMFFNSALVKLYPAGHFGLVLQVIGYKCLYDTLPINAFVQNDKENTVGDV